MSEQQPVKVYELAKELGIDSISLLDKLRGLNIQVKNHMSELGSEEVRSARQSLKAGGSPASSEATKAPKKTVTRARKKTTEAVAAPAAPVAEAPAPAAADQKKAASPIIRRRTKADGAIESSTTSTSYNRPGMSQESLAGEMGAAEFGSEEQMAAAAEHTHLMTEETGVSYEAPSLRGETASAGTLTTLSDAERADLESADIQVSEPGLEVVSPAGTKTAARATSEEPSAVAASHGLGSQVEAQATQTPAPPVKAAKPPIVFPPRPQAPRRSILKIVEPSAPPPRPMIKPTTPPPVQARPVAGRPGATTTTGAAGADKDSFRIIKMSKESLDQMVEEEAAKKRGGGGREVEIRPEDVRFADYRKKEMVFLPKKKRIPIGKEIKKTAITVAKAQKRVVEMHDTITVSDLAAQLSLKAIDIVRKLMSMGQMVNINQSLDFDTASLVANEYKYEVRNVAFDETAFIEAPSADSEENLQPRPPVVTIMGHVDHGKTTLLDAIREANVAAGEAGGITQHIGAYTIEKNGKLITFIDTPGHEAFSVMRARGANVTDIVILVVSADDGVMPQTREALSHAQAAGVPIIVAVNKIDKPGANPEKIKQALSELNLLSEDWGGDTMFIPVSALKKTNIDKLLEGLLLQAEILDLKSNPEARASGTVLEARLEKGRGPVVSLLLSRGTLRVGDALVAGIHAGRVKAMLDSRGKNVKEALPGTAVEVLGLEGVPAAGERFDATETEADARDIAQNRVDKQRSKGAAGGTGKVSLEELFSKIQTGDMKELNVVLKADVFGSVEAIRESLTKASTSKVKVKVIHSAPGGVTESDVLLASASNALIIGFNVRPETKARQVAEAEHVEIKCYSIIYELIDDVKKAMAGLLDKKKVEKFLGRAEVRQTFSVPKVGVIAGTAVIDGKVLRGANVRLLRDSRIIWEGKMSSLKRFKDDAKEVAQGFECGIGLDGYNDLKPGDLIEAYQIEMITPELTA